MIQHRTQRGTVGTILGLEAMHNPDCDIAAVQWLAVPWFTSAGICSTYVYLIKVYIRIEKDIIFSHSNIEAIVVQILGLSGLLNGLVSVRDALKACEGMTKYLARSQLYSSTVYWVKKIKKYFGEWRFWVVFGLPVVWSGWKLEEIQPETFPDLPIHPKTLDFHQKT